MGSKFFYLFQGIIARFAEIAQMVERTHGKGEVTGSIPVFSSKLLFIIAMSETVDCNHCGNKVIFEQIFKSSNPLTENDMWCDYEYLAVLLCSICNNIIIKTSTLGYLDSIDDPEHGIYSTLDDWYELYPFDISVYKHVPESIKESVLKISRSPEAYLIMLRRSLEVMIKERGDYLGNLSKNIENIVIAEEWSSFTVGCANYLREAGNKEAHELLNKSEREKLLKTATYCFNHMVDYLYSSKQMIPAINEILKTKDKIKV